MSDSVIRRFWPEEKEKAAALAREEKKLLCMEYQAIHDADSYIAVTPEEYAEAAGRYKENVYAGWIAIIADYSQGSFRAWEVLQKINERFAAQDPEEQVVDILNDFPELKLSLGEIDDVFIQAIEGAGYSCTYSIPCEQVSRGQRPGPSYFVVTSRACLEAANEAMFVAEAAMM